MPFLFFPARLAARASMRVLDHALGFEKVYERPLYPMPDRRPPR
jgi:hypothetical protein